MCLALYLASDLPLPALHPERGAPPFLVQRAKRRAAWEWLTKPYVYEVCTDDGCACGFLDDGEPDSEAPELLARLAAYVGAAAAAGPLELLAVWLGDERKEPARVTTTPPEVADLPFDEACGRPLLAAVSAR
jgi:hypothetical protein